MLCLPPHAFADLLVEKSITTEGKSEVVIVNTGAAAVKIFNVVVNDRPDGVCALVPIQSDFGYAFMREDYRQVFDRDLFADQKQIPHVTLALGEEARVVTSPSCGRVLRVTVTSSSGQESFKFER